MLRASPFHAICLAAIASTIVANASLDAAEQPAGYATPSDAWKAYQNALAAKDYRKAYSCLTAGEQENCLGELLNLMMLLLPSDVDKQTPQKQKDWYRQVYTTMASNGLDYGKMRQRVKDAVEADERRNVEMGTRQFRKLLCDSCHGNRFELLVGIAESFQACVGAGTADAPPNSPATPASATGTSHVASGDVAQPPTEVLGVKVHGDRAVMVIKRPLPESTVIMRGGERIRQATETHFFRRIDGRWFVASENNEPANPARHELKDSDLPYVRGFPMDTGDSIVFKLPDGKELAFWCRGTRGIGQVLSDSSMEIAWGEKPYYDASLKWSPRRKDGSRRLEGDDSYIRMGGVITSDHRPGLQRELFVGSYYILMDEMPAKGDTQSLTVTVRKATELEMLVGNDARQEYFLKQMKSKSVDERLAALSELLNEITLSGSDYTADPKDIERVVRPLMKDPDKRVVEAAKTMLANLPSKTAATENDGNTSKARDATGPRK